MQYNETMAKEEKKTNAMRMLDSEGITYTVHAYDVSDWQLDGVTVARKCGQDPEQVFKTLVLCGDKTGHFVCVIPGCCEVDLKKAAKVSGNKKCDLIPMKELLPLTGYIRGGCSPVGMKKPFPTYIDETASLYEYIYISAGVRGLQFKINPEELTSYVKAALADITVMK
jgi:Cys-tRNA(Pro)/Cys-tRNA(Cys) deacylase